MDKINRKKLVKKLDKVFSEYIRARDRKCICCGSTDNLQCGHLLSRVAYSTRWDEDNAHAQCRSCNLVHEYNPHIYIKAYIRIHGIDKYYELISKYSKTVKISNSELETMIEYYSNKLKSVTNVK